MNRLTCTDNGLADSFYSARYTRYEYNYKGNMIHVLKSLKDNSITYAAKPLGCRYIAGSFHNIDVEKLQDITDEQWKYILYDYNCGNSYNEKVMDYIPEIQEILN